MRPTALKPLSVALLLVFASLGYQTYAQQPTNTSMPAAAAPAQSAQIAKANALFDRIDKARLEVNPLNAAWRGLKIGNDRWPGFDDAQFEKEQALAREALREANTIDANLLDEFTRVSLAMFIKDNQEQLDDARWHYHGYLVNQMWGVQTLFPAVLINQHAIDQVQDAQAFVKRLQGVGLAIDQIIVHLKTQEQKGIMAPRFALEKSLAQTKSILAVKSVDRKAKDESPILTAFKSKVTKLKAPAKTKQDLIKQSEQAFKQQFAPAYQRLVAAIEDQLKRATNDDGVWKLPDGAAFYNTQLERHTTTQVTAEQLHELGLREVARLQNEMLEVAQKGGFKGTRSELFESLRTGKEHYFDNTDQGRQAYLRETMDAIATMNKRLPEMFNRLPKARLEVKRVESFREKGSAGAFYESPSADGKRPGRYYLNFFDMKGLPRFELQALAYHEAIPGHHMQLAIAQELTNMPDFRKYSYYTAYGEGWALYAEQIPVQMGLYQSTPSRLGQLSMALWRAARLVVDTGIHSKRWTRQQTIDYLKANTPVSDTDAVTETERYIVDAGQATAYHVGMMKIIELRDRAKTQLGDRFDIRQFHDTVLENGSMPLSILEQQVNRMIERVKTEPAKAQPAKS